MAENRSQARGRPRDPSIDARVLQAARDLVVEMGFEATTIQAIAERAGVHASAIYRRWASRPEIIEQAVFSAIGTVSVRPVGDLRRDLRRFIRSYLAVFDTPAARAAMPSLLASYQATGRSGAPEEWLARSARPQFRDLLRAAPPGAVDGKVDPDDLFDVLLGTLVARTLIPTVVERNRPVEILVEMTLRLLQPCPAG